MQNNFLIITGNWDIIITTSFNNFHYWCRFLVIYSLIFYHLYKLWNQYWIFALLTGFCIPSFRNEPLRLWDINFQSNYWYSWIFERHHLILTPWHSILSKNEIRNQCLIYSPFRFLTKNKIRTTKICNRFSTHYALLKTLFWIKKMFAVKSTNYHLLKVLINI